MQERRRSDRESHHAELVLLPSIIEFAQEEFDDSPLDPWDRVGLTREERARLKGPSAICLTDGDKHIQLMSPNHVERGPERDEQLIRLQDCLDAGFQLVG
ncbi:MAG: hypothetical protein NXI30_03055 [bacterium]|nr:hypothetical protein [bacterium]